MTAAAPSRGRLLPGWLLPLVVTLVVVAALATFFFLAQRVGQESQPPQLSTFSGPDYVQPTSAFDVKQRDGGVLQLVPAGTEGQPQGATRTVNVGSGTRLERLEATTVGSVVPGDWVTVVGVPNKVRNFAIRSVVVIPGGKAAGGETFARSAGGFLGHEVARDAKERPIIGGTVREVSGNSIVFDGPDGAVTVDLAAKPPLFRIVGTTVDAVAAGDRAAAGMWADGAAPAAMLFSK